MLQPKRTKYRKPHVVYYTGKPKGNKYVAFGEYGLISTEGNWVSNKQIESARIVLSKAIGNVGKLWIRIFPHLSLTSKGIGSRLGGGKGSPSGIWVAVVKQGTVMFEIAGIPETAAKEALRKAGNKLNLLSKFVRKGEIPHE